MVVPGSDPAHPAAPRPDGRFLDTLCAYLEPRRLVTTEIALHGPKYKGIWLSVGIEVAGGHSVPETVEAVRALLHGSGSLGDNPLWGHLFVLDGLEPSMRSLTIAKDPACKGCG